MELTGTQTIGAARDKVWAALFDPAVLKQCIPGCESVEVTGENELAAKVTLRIGPVKASFSGRVTLSDLVAPESCTLAGEGQGGVAGFAKGGAKVRLTQESPDSTLLTYEAKADVGGKLAQLGGRLIDATARKLAGDFFVRFGEVVVPQAVEPGDAKPAGEATHAAAEVADEANQSEQPAKKSWLGGLFGKSTAVVLVAGGLTVPTCCLDGSHAHSFDAVFFGPICGVR